MKWIFNWPCLLTRKQPNLLPIIIVVIIIITITVSAGVISH